MTLNREIKRFILIGLISTLINYLVYILTIKIYSNIPLSSFLGYSSGLVYSFIFGKKYVFKDLSKINTKLITKFLLIYFFGGLGMTVIIYFLIEFGLNYKAAWIFGLIFSVINNFIGCKLYVINTKKRE